ncbi:MAG: response regulator [Chloroflexi bacterium]|nr:response regulator [Chloroflexota bacterium]
MVCHVVAIEDEPEIAELLRIVLASPEIKLHTADNGTEGLALIRAVRPNLVMLDIMLPGQMNGWQVYDAMRADETIRQTPAIMLSVLREEPARHRAFADSAIDVYVTKPFDTLGLRREIERLLKRPGLWSPPRPAVAHVFGLPGTADPSKVIRIIGRSALPLMREGKLSRPAVVAGGHAGTVVPEPSNPNFYAKSLCGIVGKDNREAKRRQLVTQASLAPAGARPADERD